MKTLGDGFLSCYFGPHKEINTTTQLKIDPFYGFGLEKLAAFKCGCIVSCRGPLRPYKWANTRFWIVWAMRCWCFVTRRRSEYFGHALQNEKYHHLQLVIKSISLPKIRRGSCKKVKGACRVYAERALYVQTFSRLFSFTFYGSNRSNIL